MPRKHHDINPWVRAELETDNPETRALIPEELHELYTDIMGRLAIAKYITNAALGELYQVEEERAKFFDGLGYGRA